MEAFAGKVAVVTGAGSGIGRAIAERFAREQMKIVIADLEPEYLQEVGGGLRSEGHEVIEVPTDVSAPASVFALKDRTLEAFGAVHVVVNNAGVMGYANGHLWEASENDWAWTLGVNLGGAINGLRAFLPVLVAQDEGYLVNTSSVVAAWTAGGMYGITKHASLALTEAVYGDLKGAGSKVAVSVLCPGGTNTNLFSDNQHRPQRWHDEHPMADPARGQAARRHMAERVAEAMPPAEVANILVEAMKEERFYVFTGGQWDDRIKSRAENMLNGTNPQLQPL
ncbi:MAG: SDR family NAD(P)-dependent oxidoreductase [Acidimicrobiales bacterium]